MNTFLLKLLELSLHAGALTVAILVIRLVFRKLPAKYLCVLWMIVAARLIIPFSIETGFAWAPSIETSWRTEVKEETAEGNYAIGSNDYFFNDDGIRNEEEIYGILTEETVNAPETDVNAEGNNTSADPTSVPTAIRVSDKISALDWKGLLLSLTPVLFGLWLLGMVILLGYGAFSCFKVKRLVKKAIPYEENIWLCEGLETPFLCGWIHPQIFLPTNLEENRMQYVIEHEKAHIARGDNYSKLVGYALLSVYWFNPLTWIAYVMFCKDVERACDERVIGGFSAEDRKGYAEALLECSVDRRFSISNPLAFGENDVKKRIGGILKYKKPGKVLVILAALLCVVAVAGCFFVKKEDGGNTNLPEMTPTAAPTAAADATPTHPPRGDGPSTSTPVPTQAVPQGTITPLPPSDLELLGNCTKETVLPVPFGRTVSVDLNGDGVEESVTFGLEGYEGDVSIMDLGGVYAQELYYLQINDRVWYQPEIAEEFWEYSGVGNTTYYIFDVDTSDKYKEIGIYFPGPNTPTGVALFRFADGKIHFIGNFMSRVLESDRGYNYYLTYNELVTQVKREGYEISVPGDGTILCRERRDLLDTSFSVQKFELYNASSKYAVLRRVERERYELLGWQNDNGEFNCHAAREFTAYLSPVDMNLGERKDTVTVTIPEGTRTAFYAYYPDNGWTAGWVQFAYGENLENFAWFYKGVDATGRFMIYLPDETEKDIMNLFYNLNMAG